MAGLDDLERRLTTIGLAVERGVERLVRSVAIAADQAVVLATPVDRGRARSNWIVTLRQPATNTREPYVPGEGGSTGSQNAQAALEHGRGVIAGYHLVDGSIHISNNLPYIARLDEGSSAQAPANFVRRAVMTAVRAAKGIRILED